MKTFEVTDDARFEFDLRGFLHLRGAMEPDEVNEYLKWGKEAEDVDLEALNADFPEGMKRHSNRPVSRIIDVDPRFAIFWDHPSVVPFIQEFLGEDYKHIDNELYYTYPAYKGGGWHRGVNTHPTGHVVNGKFICPMVKVFYCITDVGPGQGEFEVVPGSHRAQFVIDTHGRIDLPGQHIFDDVRAGDIIIFNEGLLHNGRPNPTDHTRKTIIVNLGRADAGVWEGYRPREETLAAVTPRQREILSNTNPEFWKQPVLV